MDGKIDGRYRVSCYRAVLDRVPTHLISNTVRTDVSAGLTVGIRRLEERGTAVIGPQTVLPPPATAAPVIVLTASRPSHSVVTIVAAAILVLLLIVWCIDRWRRTLPPRLRL